MNDPVQSLPREGQSIPGGFTLEKLIASGGMAYVYRGVDAQGSPVTIKIMRHELLEEPTVRARFVREGKLCQAFVHEGVPRIFALADLPDGTVAIAMELLAGETVAQRARRNGGYLPPQEALAIADRVLDVLEAAHARHIVHRDIKPDNVFLTTAGELKLLDFGVASAREQDGEKLTHAGYALGTPAFMSPEQAQGRWDDVDGRTDLWAVGATMFALLVGEPPHAAASPIQEFVAAATETVPPIRSRVPGLRRAVASLVDRALERDADARFADATAMRVAVRAAWLALGGPASMQRVWDRIASEVVASCPEIEIEMPRYASGQGTIAQERAPVTSDVVPASAPTSSGWSVPPPSDAARIVTREDLEKSGGFAALEPLLRKRSDPKMTPPVVAPPSRSWISFALAVVVVLLGLAVAFAWR